VALDTVSPAATLVELILPYVTKRGLDERTLPVWREVQTQAAERPVAGEALQDLEANPADDDARAAVRLQFRKMLGDNPPFAERVAALVESVPAHKGISVSGDSSRSVNIGLNVSGSVLVSGDRLSAF